ATGGILAATNFAIGIDAAHRTNITNAGDITGSLAGIAETGEGDFRIENAKGGKIFGTLLGIDVESTGTHSIINVGRIESAITIRGAAGVEHVNNAGNLIGDVDLGEGNDTFTNVGKIGNILKAGFAEGTLNLGDGSDTFRNVLKVGK